MRLSAALLVSATFTASGSSSSDSSTASKKRSLPPLPQPQPPSIRFLPHPTKIKLNSTLLPNMKKSNNKKKKSSTTTDVLRLMDSLQLPIQSDFYACLLKECTESRDIIGGAEVHRHINQSSLRPDIPLINRLLLMYVFCGHLHFARQLFDEMPDRDFISWAIVITGHAKYDDHQRVLRLFLEMQQHGIHPTNSILGSTLKACAQGRHLNLGKQVHAWIWKLGFGRDMLLCGSIIDFYRKFGYMQFARKVFDQMPNRGSIIWTAMIVGYCNEDGFNEAIQLFKEMGRSGKRKNSFTFSSVLCACGRIQDDGRNGRQVHAQAIKLGVELDSFVQSSLVNMYGKCGLLGDARKVFEMTAQRDIISWNAMLNSYTRRGHCNEAIKLLYEMKAAGIEPPELMLNEVKDIF